MPVSEAAAKVLCAHAALQRDFRTANFKRTLSFAYGGAAYRAGRQAQARAINNLLSGKPIDGARAKQPRSKQG
jgi:hypothetical protein